VAQNLIQFVICECFSLFHGILQKAVAMTTAYGQIADEVDRKMPETRQDDGFQGSSDFNVSSI
jgi:hypothetical protein